MAEWTQEQKDRINDDYWLDRETMCPLCGADVRVIESKQVGYPKSLFSNCVGCGARATIRSATEQGERFSEKQLREFVGLYQRGSDSVCLHDGTRLKVREVRTVGACRYMVTCPRCGAAGQLEWKPEERG